MKSIGHYNGDEYLLSFQRGEEAGFSWFFQQHYAALRSFANGFVKDIPLAEDITGESFIKLWNRRSAFNSTHSIRAFLYVVVRNACLSHLRRQKILIQNQNNLVYVAEKNEESILQKIMHTEKLSEVYTALSTLPPGCGQVIRMIYIEGKNYEEIASELQLSVNTIRNHRARGITLLKKMLLLIAGFLFLFA